MNREITIVVNARVQSTRVHKKLIRPFADTTLLNIALKKLEALSDHCPCFLAAADEEIIEMYNKTCNSDVGLIVRDAKAVQKGFNDYRIAFSHYAAIDTPYIMWVNPCAPFVKLATYLRAIDYFQNNTNIKTMTSIKGSNNMFLNSNMEPLNFQGQKVRTVQNESIYEWSHLFHFFDKQYFLTTGNFWDYTEFNPSYYKVDSEEESIDVDEPIDFVLAELLYKAKQDGLKIEDI